MKKIIALLLALSMTLALTACGKTETTSTQTTAPEASFATASNQTTTGEKVEVTVFAAASMTETLTKIAERYQAEHHDIDLVFNFDSSGTLKTQIQEGADCDLFISAAQKQMNQMDSADTTGTNQENLDLIKSETRVDLLENKVTLCVPSGNPKALTGFDDLTTAFASGDFLLAMGNSDVPVGQYTQKILAYYQLSEEDLANSGMITYGSNVKEVTTQVAEGSVDCGVIYCTDAYSAGLEIVDYATAEMCGRVIYPAAVLKHSTHPDQAQAFLDYLTTENCMTIFEEVGFCAVK